VVSEHLTAEETAARLGITLNNLRQIQFRGNLRWVKREGRKVYYLASDVDAYAAKRRTRKTVEETVS
jgi:predicted site-specific integrase-resolvase